MHYISLFTIIAIMTRKNKVFKATLNRKMIAMLMMGFSSGLPLSMTLSTLMLWYQSYGISIQSISFLTLLGLPYAFKPLWAPLVDRFHFLWLFPILDHRRSWIVLMQILLLLSVYGMSYFSPGIHPWTIACIALLITCLSATQDIAFNAYQIEVLSEKEKALGVALGILGYRIAMFVSGGIFLLMVATLHENWNASFKIISLFFIVGMVGSLIAPRAIKNNTPVTLFAAFVYPFVDFIKRCGTLRRIIIILLVITTYKLSDQIAFSLNTVFFKSLGFSLDQIATGLKVNGLVCTLSGAVIGGIFIKKVGLYRSIFIFSFFMACANLMYFMLALVGNNFTLMFISVAVEYFIGSIGTVILVALLMSFVNIKFSATQFALFSSLDSIGRIIIGPFAGYAQTQYNWTGLFFISFLVGLLITWFLWIVRNDIVLMGNLHKKL